MNKIELKDVIDSLENIRTDRFHNYPISCRNEDGHLLIFFQGYYIDLNPDGTYLIFSDYKRKIKR